MKRHMGKGKGSVPSKGTVPAKGQVPAKGKGARRRHH